MTAPQCLDREDDPCVGEVAYRESLSGTGTPIPRCDRHWSIRLDVQDEHRRRYPDTATPPSWFDPSAAGECWDEY